MKKKVLIGIIALIVLIMVVFIFYWFYNTQTNAQNIRSKVLSQLEQNFEFCSILSDNINSFSGTGEFWMICNGRPFYAEYKNGNVSYELNGWGFLKKDPNLWKDLSNCDFYDSKRANDYYELIFYCPKDFKSEKLIAKIYKFNPNSLSTSKIEDKDFLEILKDDIKEIYTFLSDCKSTNFTIVERNASTLLLLTLDCKNETYNVVIIDLVGMTPPVLIGKDLSYQDMARLSFKKAFDLDAELSNVTTNTKFIRVTSSFDTTEFLIYYNFEDLVAFPYRINSSNVEMFLKRFGNRFLLPPLKKIENVTFIKELEETWPPTLVYKVGNKIIMVKKSDVIVRLKMKSEAMFR